MNCRLRYCEKVILVQPIDSTLRPVDEPSMAWRRVATDPAPRAFTFAVGGVRTLPPYELLENTKAFPRAFVVPKVDRLPDDRAGIVRAMTSNDFRRVALIEAADLPDFGPASGTFRPAEVRSYQPNRIEVDAEGPGLLVLADPWYPGWTAAIDGAATTLYRVDFLFRGATLTPGRHVVTFTFQPWTLRIGRWVSSLTWAAVATLTVVTLSRRRRIS